MNNIHKIENNLGTVSQLFYQYGEIAGLIIGSLLVSLFITQQVILVVLLIFVVFSIFVLLLSKYNKPVILVKIDYATELIIFLSIIYGWKKKTTKIPFQEIKIINRPRLLFKSYNEVLEIRHEKKLKIVIPRNSKSNSRLIDQFLNEIKLLEELNKVNNEQININMKNKHLA